MATVDVHPQSRARSGLTSTGDAADLNHALGGDDWSRRTYLTVVGLLTGLTTVLALFSLTDRSIWIDEAFTRAVATAPSDRLISDLSHNGGNMSLYLLLMRGWLVFSQSDWWLRLPSLIFAAASVPAVFHLAQQIVSRRAALIAAAVLAVSPPLMHHAQDARSYTLTVLLVIASSGAVLRLHRETSPAHLRWYVIFAAAVMYSHMIGALFVASQLLWLFFVGRRTAVRAALWVGALVTPQVAVGLGPSAHEPDWIPPLSATQIGTAVRFLAGAETHALAVLVVLGWILGGFAVARRTRTDPSGYLLISWSVLPFFGLLAVSLVAPMFIERYLLMIVPAGALLVAVAYETFPRVGSVTVIAILILSAFGLSATVGRDAPDWRSATDQLLATADADEAVLFIRSRHLVEHYWDEAGRPRPAPVPLSEPHELGSVWRTYELDITSARAVLRRSGGAWIVDRARPFGLPDNQRQLMDEIERRWPVSTSWSLDDGQIVITHHTAS